MPAFTFAGAGHQFLLNLKHNAVSLAVDEFDVCTFDLEGRLVTSVLGGKTHRRGLDNRVLCRWRERKGTIQRRRWLSAIETGELIGRTQDFVQAALSVLEQNPPKQERIPDEEGGRNEAISRLRRILSFDAAALARDSAAMSRIYRRVSILPPDQYLALVLQATEGCSYGRCSFCSFYRDRPFRIKSLGEFSDHIREVLDFLGEGIRLRNSVFLADANALCIPRLQLLPMLGLVRDMLLPLSAQQAGRASFLHGINSFVDAFSKPQRTAADYEELKEYGVRRLYLGVETGCAELLRFLRKPQQPDDVVETIRTIKAGGLRIGVILLLGIGGDKFASRHVKDSLTLLNSLAWGEGDSVFLSQLVEFPNLEYADLASAAGIRSLSEREIHAQYAALREGIRRKDSVPKIAPYNAEEFVY
jgi:radical SAM superfamily enzyme YgiQ (UPF0313 family)